MEKYFVNYEIASQLEQLGWDEKCIATIEREGYLHIKGTRRPAGGGALMIAHSPLKSQVFEWFRNKYTMCGEIYPLSEKWRFQIHCLTTHSNYTGWVDLEYSFYEEAEDECIKQMIKLVK